MRASLSTLRAAPRAHFPGFAPGTAPFRDKPGRVDRAVTLLPLRDIYWHDRGENQGFTGGRYNGGRVKRCVFRRITPPFGLIKRGGGRGSPRGGPARGGGRSRAGE